ncbi:MAG: type II CRISPR-associated endonuclease Cas1, partial [Tistlia sp.]
MIGGLVEVMEAGRHLAVHRGFLKVSDEGGEIGRVALDDITALILAGPQVTLSKALMVELAERRAVIVTCGRNWHPVALTLPFDSHFESAGVLHDQIAASEPLRKRLWQALVRAKIANQAQVLKRYRPAHPALDELDVLFRQVRSGDLDNREAQAARHYWPALMGSEFRRDRRAEGVNALLNYGYTVLRA